MTMRAINRLKIIDLTKDEDCSRTKKIEFCVSYSMFPETRSLFERILAKCRKTRPGLKITFRLWMNVVTTEWEIALSSFTSARDNAPLFSHFSKTIHKKCFHGVQFTCFSVSYPSPSPFSSVLYTKCLCWVCLSLNTFHFACDNARNNTKKESFTFFPARMHLECSFC